ncbi:ABC transporter permease subunit [Cylindrospermopsis raciborskii CHAB3438]|jgi:putative chitobiose transport system permease protein|uniref:carbohydrate ABC transporter permease n=2 Tax=Aphanizomenonaceae TaxID=1892259 RepID=UPI000708AEAD|nr:MULTISPECIES: sugar ABC transporter permease [Cylindrospermopsis]MBU6344737.1 sugar ABC transporter permease [Cyanobacteria bacterium REEB494]KRH95982.1 lactose ABC transporter permease [Cylindrospermopsis sp. CR12]MCH4902965.1 ABC transporter permease subunit [Cylindrospermopsis raciborskii CHAB3438]TPX28615.1 sugar ABC transporter permease [Cylindrospermopsis raciborskii GIHE 2018]UJL33195.1 sugar ABC transporter permease [Cylindrospermopsis raciborskii Cr2010]
MTNQLTFKTWNRIKQKLTPYFFLIPALFLLSLTVFVPALQAFYLSFTTYQDIGESPKFIGIDNFVRLWYDPVFWLTLVNTIVYLVGVVPILVILPLILAILVNQKLRGMSWFRTAYYTPVVISMVVAGIAWKWLYAENGLLNQLIKTLGIFPDGIPWLTSPDKILGIVPISLASVMVVTIWKGLGYYMVIYLAGLQSIPEDIYEAAAIDGSEGIRQHIDITIPLMRPYLALVAVISAISATKVFEEVYIMTGGGPINSSKTIVYYLYEQAFSNLQLTYACTIGLVLFLIILGLSYLQIGITRER